MSESHRPDDINRRILIADDNEAIHEDFSKLLARTGPDLTDLDAVRAQLFGVDDRVEEVAYELSSAYQGEEAVELVRMARHEDRPFALAFVDVRMPPGIDGIQTIRRIYEIDSEIQVVVCTAHMDYSWREMVNELGTTDRLLVLKKPFDTIEVQQLALALVEKWSLTRKAGLKRSELEALIRERTDALRATYQKLIDQADQRREIQAERDAEMQKTKRLEALGDLCQNAALQFNRQLQLILGHLELALNDLTDPEAAGRLRTAADETSKSATLCQSLLTFSRCSNCERVSTDINAFVEDTVTGLRLLLGPEYWVELQLSPAAVCAPIDKDLIVQCLCNLCLNARDAMPEGGTMTIQTHAVELDQSQCDSIPGSTPGRHVVLSVDDEGCGMDAELIERIFEPFFTTKEVAESAGLGLPLVFGAVGQHGGAVTVNSVPGGGATVSLYLPAAADETPSHTNSGAEIDIAPEADPELAALSVS